MSHPSQFRSARSNVLGLASFFALTIGGCEGCPLIPPAPECTADSDCAAEETCENERCLAPGVDDAGTSDAGTSPIDGGPTDAGAAPEVDAGANDAGPFDAGVDDAGPAGVDAGPIDAGSVDAGPIDAGPIDAGVVDLQCTSTRDCDGDRRCSDLRDEGDSVAAYCRTVGQGAGQIGEACTVGNGCEAGLCVPRARVCSEACAVAATDCGANTVCTAYPFGATNGFTFISICALACGGDGDCPQDRVCTYNGNPLTNAFEGVCEVVVGAATLGESCTAATDCESALCLAEGCTRACVDDTDCEGGTAANPMATCSDVVVADPNDTGSQTIRMCR